MESTRRDMRCLSLIIGLAIAAFSLTAQGQSLNVSLTNKTFSPAAIPVGGRSTLTILITNSTGAQISNVAFVDTLPPGMIALTWLQGLACGNAGTSFGFSSTTVFATVTIAAGATCAISYLVTANGSGIFTNSTANITSWNGNVLAFPSASLFVGISPTPPTVPTLSRLSLVLLALGVAGLTYRSRFRGARSRREKSV
jgi:uncharacterized repeat protein (TIGR01451 family)